jgi:dienelactone hydrolase
MRKAVVALVLLFIGLAGCAPDTTALDRSSEIEFVPPAGKGRVVVVLSGSSGSANYRFAGRDLAAQGYYVVLHNGNLFMHRNPATRENLRQAISRAQASPHAIPGKVGAVGYSLGGGTVIGDASSMPDLVAVGIAYYPVTTLVNQEDIVRLWAVPTLALMGEADPMPPVRIDALRAMAEPARRHGADIELVTYPATGHDFNWPASAQQPATDDAWRRTLAALRQHLGS